MHVNLKGLQDTCNSLEMCNSHMCVIERENKNVFDEKRIVGWLIKSILKLWSFKNLLVCMHKTTLKHYICYKLLAKSFPYSVIICSYPF
jgi:hypothetical protein